jgi:hypothetical protein
VARLQAPVVDTVEIAPDAARVAGRARLGGTHQYHLVERLYALHPVSTDLQVFREGGGEDSSGWAAAWNARLPASARGDLAASPSPLPSRSIGYSADWETVEVLNVYGSVVGYSSPRSTQPVAPLTMGETCPAPLLLDAPRSSDTPLLQFPYRARQSREHSDYHLGDRVGRGGCGEVWRAFRLFANGSEDTSSSFVLKRMYSVSVCLCVWVWK